MPWAVARLQEAGLENLSLLKACSRICVLASAVAGLRRDEVSWSAAGLGRTPRYRGTVVLRYAYYGARTMVRPDS
jgi:hypothetical protein